MIIENPSIGEFEFNEKIFIDKQNEGFTEAEMAKLTKHQQAVNGAKGIDDIWNRIWKKNREIPPEITQLKSEFGTQTQPILTDLIDVAKIQGTVLDGQILALSKNYNFFVMRCGVYILPQNNEKFQALKFKVNFVGDNVSTYSMLPGPQAKKIFEMGGKADVGITGKIDFGFPSVALDKVSFDASAKAELDAEFIVSFHYELKTQLVDAFGAGNSFCQWMMYKGENLRNDVIFYPIVMAPRTVTSFTCNFESYFKIDHPDWANPEFFLKPSKSIEVFAP